MTDNSRAKLFQTALVYISTALLSLLAVTIVLQLWRSDLQIPYAYEWRDIKRGGEHVDPIGSNDAILFFALIKGERENGWYLRNPNLAVPETFDMRDYPMSDGLHFLFLKVIGWLTPNYGASVNIYFLLGFPLAALTTLFAFRQLGVHTSIAMAASQIYAFLPYHFLRGEQNLFLASYWMVPLLVVTLLWVVRGESFFTFRTEKKWWPMGVAKKGWAAVVICVLTASSGVYYALFGIFFFFIGVLIFQRKWTSILSSIACSGLIAATLLLNIFPTIQRIVVEGSNKQAAAHLASDGERYALKIIQMLLPVPYHRLPSFSEFSLEYLHTAPLLNENVTASLGAAAGTGFVLLVLWQLGIRWESVNASLLTQLGTMNMAAILLATMGGVSSWFCYAFSPLLRCYNRMSIFIALFSLMALALILQKVFFGPNAQRKPSLGIKVMILFTLLALLDQTTSFFVPPYAQSESLYRNDEVFVEQIEDSVPTGTSIFQMPNLLFPIGMRGGVKLLRPYLHSKHLNWSYGVLPGRIKDDWRYKLDFREDGMKNTLQTLWDRGYRGVYLDRSLVSNHVEIVGRLRRLIKGEPLVSRNSQQLFFRLEEMSR